MKALFKFIDRKIFVRLNLIFLISVFTVLFETISIVSIFPLIKIFFEPNFINEKLNFLDLNLTYSQTIIYLLIFVIIIFLIKNILLFSFSVLSSKFINFATVNLTSKFFENYLSLNYLDFIKYNTSYYVRNVIENINAFFGIYFKSIVTLFVESLMTIVLIVVLFKVDYISTILFLGIFSVSGIIIFYFSKKNLMLYGTNINKYFTKKLIDLNHGFSSFKDITLTDSNKFFIRSFNSNLRNIAITSYKADAINALPRLILEVIGVGVILIFIYLNFIKSDGSNDYFATLSLFALAGLRMLPSASKILSSFNRLKFSGPSIKILENELIRFKASNNKKNIVTDPKLKIDFKKEIRIKNLKFSYDNSRYIFEKLNINFKKGETTLIFGASGCGKSTLLNILLGFLNPISGKVLSDDKDIFLNLPSWRSNLAYVPQEIYLNDEKLILNIAFGCNENEIDKGKILKILDILKMRSFVENLPMKLDTRMGEKAFKISGGQRQRIALARCLYGEKKIIILDEATSALDRNTELEILNNIKVNYKDTTIILVTHRDYLKKFADKVYRLDTTRNIIENEDD
jgi:ABC-type bacteriocin/lantibiotic exporter with double-glycine peptidase domain